MDNLKLQGRIRKLLLIAFLFSGMAALIYEIVWIRALKLTFGSTALSLSVMFTAIFVGFALGSYLLRKKADTTTKPLHLLFQMQVGIGIYGILLIFLLKILPVVVAPLPGPAKYATAFLLLLTPATLLGAIWPILYKAYIKNTQTIGKDAGTLYFTNSAGAAVGALVTGFLLIPFLGLTATSLLASAVNITLALIFLGTSKVIEK